MKDHIKVKEVQHRTCVHKLLHYDPIQIAASNQIMYERVPENLPKTICLSLRGWQGHKVSQVQAPLDLFKEN